MAFETGKYIKMGEKWGTNYSQDSDGMFELMRDAYGYQIGMFKKSAGAAVYGNNGYFNAIMGKEITATMFASDYAYTMIGAKPYDHEGVRLALRLATVGKDASGKFVGLGAYTVQDGSLPASVRMDVGEYRQPYKELPFKYAYGTGLMALEAKDDTISHTDYVNKMTANYSDLMDKTILRPIWVPQPTVDGTETSLNSFGRCISASNEIGMVENGVTITDDMVCPYGGMNGDFTLRAESHAAGKSTNLDSHVIDAGGMALGTKLMRKLWRSCSPYWGDGSNPNNKIFLMSNLAQDVISQAYEANNILINTVFVQRDFNGVKSIPGRDAGILVNSFQNTPMMQDCNINYDYVNEDVSINDVGNVYLMDLDHIWLSMFEPLAVQSINQFVITDDLRQHTAMNMRAETRINSFKQHGKIVNLADAEA